MRKEEKALVADQSGAMAVMVALLLVVLLTASALAIYYGHMAWVHNELQKAADAGALAGARALAPYVGDPVTPDWIAGRNKASETVLLNRADAQAITDCQVDYGYWSLSTKTLQSAGIVPTISDLPAIRVRISKAAGHNGGPLRTFFAPVFGVNSRDLRAQAIAVISGPYNIPPHGGAFPMAVPQNLVDQYWNQDPPVSFKIGALNQDSDSGQWTSFSTNANDVPTIRDLISNGNPSALTVGDNIWIDPGTKTTLYDDAAKKIGKTVIVPVVNADFATHSFTPILGFVSFCIEDVAGGDDKYIQGHFVKNVIDDANSGGPVFGTFASTTNLVY
jgi:hypothetical protein